MSPVPSACCLPAWFGELSADARTVWLTRTDLHAAYRGSRTAFLAWCLIEGRLEYRCFDPLSLDFDTTLTERVWEGCPEGVDPPLTELMHGVWARRPDLQAEFDLTLRDGAQAFVGWFFVEGIRELDLTPLLTPAQIDSMTQLLPGIPVVAGLLDLTRIQAITYARRDDLQAAFDVRTLEGRHDLAAWFLTEGLREIGDMRLADEPGQQWFRTSSTEAVRRFGLTVTNGAFHIWQSDPELRERYPLDRKGLWGFQRWVADEGRRLYPLLADVTGLAMLAKSARRRPMLLTDGVNLIGHARADMGIGEDLRAAARALDAVRIPYVIVDVKPSADISTGERVNGAKVLETPVYDTTLFCTTGMEMARVVAARGGSFLDGQRVIGCWPWELPAWPEPWRHALKLVDEIWAASRHAEAAYRGASATPIRWMPMSVTVPAPAPYARADLGLADDQFLFLFAFDTLSYLPRKNPFAVIDAFRHAFPGGDEPVGLVLKVMRASADPATWQRVEAAAAEDRRIRILSQTVSRYELVALYQACDALVSLHRAEGFGRVLAEMMLLGKPVIATGWSGNADFLTTETGCPLPYRLVPIGTGEYPYGDGMAWAEPDLGAAVEWMRRLAADRTLAAAIGSAGRAEIRRNNSPEAVGRRYLAALEAPLAANRERVPYGRPK